MGFKEYVQHQWISDAPVTHPNQLHEKLERIKAKMATWAKSNVGSIKKQIKVCRQFIGWIDEAQERRALTQLERRTVAIIKKRFHNLAIMEEDMWKQRAKAKWEAQGDKNTRLFHAYASVSKERNNIGEIQINGHTHADQKAKAAIFRDFYKALMGTKVQGNTQLDWASLYPQQTDLTQLQRPIDIQEVRDTILSWPSNKAPGPDGLSGDFYKAFLDTIIQDIYAVI